ncbi:MAG: hypothetical protein ACTSVV_02315 [Promethearchaeota archaeon]
MENSELISFIILSGVFIFIFMNYGILKTIISFKTLLLSLVFLYTALIFTILEDYYYPDIFNLLEHFFNTLFSIGILIWIIKIRKGEES